MALQSLDIVRRSATTTAPPGVREAYTGTVAKLIDTTKCIGCKACQVACMEWNDLARRDRQQCRRLRQPRRSQRRVLDGDALHRVREPQGRSRMADPQGRLHALRRPGVPESLPGAGCDRAVLERYRGLSRRELHRLRVLH